MAVTASSFTASIRVSVSGIQHFPGPAIAHEAHVMGRGFHDRDQTRILDVLTIPYQESTSIGHTRFKLS